MKKTVIFLVLLVLTIPFSSAARVVEIKDIFKVEEPVVDSFGGKSSTSATTYIYAGSKLLATKNNEEIKYNYQDRLGSDINSKTLPFGQEIYSEERFSFTGKELDNDLYYFGARYYDANTGRFTSTDPIPSEPVYQYVGNNPMNLIDPTGMAYVPEDSLSNSENQMNYFSQLETFYNEGGIPEDQISEMRDMVANGQLRFYPEGSDLPAPANFQQTGKILFSNFILDWLGHKIASGDVWQGRSENPNYSEEELSMHIAIRATDQEDWSVASGTYELYSIYKSTENNIQHEDRGSRYLDYRSHTTSILLIDQYIGARQTGNFLKRLGKPLNTMQSMAASGDFSEFYRKGGSAYDWIDSNQHSSYQERFQKKFHLGKWILKALRLSAFVDE